MHEGLYKILHQGKRSSSCDNSCSHQWIRLWETTWNDREVYYRCSKKKKKRTNTCTVSISGIVQQNDNLNYEAVDMNEELYRKVKLDFITHKNFNSSKFKQKQTESKSKWLR